MNDPYTCSFPRGMILSPVCSYPTLTRQGFDVPADGQGCSRLILDSFSPKLLNFALKIYDRKNEDTIALCINGKKVVLLSKQELIQRLHLKKSKCTEENLPRYLERKKAYFFRLPQIIEQAQKLLFQYRADIYPKQPLPKQAEVLTVSRIMKYVRVHFTQYSNPIICKPLATLTECLWRPYKSLWKFEKNKEKTLENCSLLIKTLAHAHSLGIVYLGISPDMILIEGHNEEVPRLILGGWSRAQNLHQLQWGEDGKHPLAYIPQLQRSFAPPLPNDFERILQAPDFQTLKYMCEKVDVYTIGCIIYTILTMGSLPYQVDRTGDGKDLHFCKAPLEKYNYPYYVMNLLQEMTHPNYWMRPTAKYVYENFVPYQCRAI